MLEKIKVHKQKLIIAMRIVHGTIIALGFYKLGEIVESIRGAF
jgi:hypothetical protein